MLTTVFCTGDKKCIDEGNAESRVSAGTLYKHSPVLRKEKIERSFAESKELLCMTKTHMEMVGLSME